MVIILATPVVQLTNINHSSTPYARHPFKQPKSKHNAQPQPFPTPRSINSANRPPFHPQFFSKTFSKPPLDCTAAPELTCMYKKQEACSSNSSEIPQNYNKARAHHKTKDNSCSTIIIERKPHISS